MGSTWRLRGYTIERLLGSGSSADVWRAKVSATGDLVALKRIHLDDPERIRQAHAEAALLIALDHPSLIRLHAVVPTGDSIALVLDLADGGNLAELLAVRGRLTPGETITAVAPIAAAVSYLHTNSVVHGDVSAANILFTDTGHALLADVGVARFTGDNRDAESTPAYIDPGVAAGGLPGPQSDVFMLGAVTFHALTGESIWRAASAESTLALACRGVPADLAARLTAAGVGDEMARPVLRAMDADPYRRGTAVEFALDLRNADVPLAVELGAGRERRAPHLIDRGSPALPSPGAMMGGPAGVDTAPGRAAADPEPDEPKGGQRNVDRLRVDPDRVDRHRAVRPRLDRPEFDRPDHRRPELGREPPTRHVRPRPRPVIPRQSRHSRRAAAARDRRRGVLLGVAALLVGALALAAWAWLPDHGHARAPAQAAADPERVTAHPGPQRPSGTRSATRSGAGTGNTADRGTTSRRDTASSTPGRSPTRPSTVRPSTGRAATSPSPVTHSSTDGQHAPSRRDRGPATANGWVAELAELDAIRAEAYATRRPALLARVFVPGSLLDRDRNQLRRLVPSGCGLVGALTSYRDVRLRQLDDTGAQLTVSAVVAPTRLVCADRTVAVRASAQQRLRVSLARTASGPRITAMTSAE